ncbi:IclR family transcriptional regulator C-terminal domain-containing protein [uncultured Ilyobacter sp.]|uniref:IclR family transcriptional regulator n=1 Tax=uncultured Ilyobacter sp. TaxID=544433 RepID=UPI0029C0D9F7|nr:IclR family transcriptional regulator C-terminal domain-containing protein [uncultured Ilyobacter sp.]
MKLIQSIQRAIDIINCFDNNNKTLTLNNISEKLELNINTTRGITNTLVFNNLLDHNLENNTYSLGSFYITKSNLSYSNTVNKLKFITKPYLKELAEKYKVSSRLQIVFGSEIMSVKTINPESSYYILATEDYMPLPLHATSSGKLFLKYNQNNSVFENLKFEKFTKFTILDEKRLIENLKEIDKNGYSLEFGETGLGVSSIAVPILNEDGSLFATISITGLTPVIKDILKHASEEMLKYKEIITKKFWNTL